jgi:hypothetical protein
MEVTYRVNVERFDACAADGCDTLVGWFKVQTSSGASGAWHTHAVVQADTLVGAVHCGKGNLALVLKGGATVNVDLKTAVLAEAAVSMLAAAIVNPPMHLTH